MKMAIITFTLSVILGTCGMHPCFADNAVVCFSEVDAARLLRVVEKDLPDCQAGAKAADETIEAEELRIDELRGERDQCAEASKKAAKASEKAVDEAKGSWWDRLKSSAVKVGAGVLIGIGIALAL
jgi:hypothetical protein